MSTDTTVSPLRQRMIEDMAARKLGPHSQRGHIYSCKRFAAFLKRSPDTATADERSPLSIVHERAVLGPASQLMDGGRTCFRCQIEQHRAASWAGAMSPRLA